ncbi:MAG: hypothetical protein WD824_09410 [Cyclobacteriaceae bacterium]
MKKILALVFALIAIGHVNANEINPKSPVGISVVKQGNIVKLFYRGEQAGKVKIAIYNEKGNEVFTETMRNREHFMRPYNFSSLPEGNYTIQLSDANGKHFQKVKHSLSNGKRVAHLSRLSKEQNKYMLAVPNKGTDALTVKIFDERNTLLYQGTEVIDGNFARLYDLSKVKGEHIFEIIDQNGNVNRLTKPSVKNK